MSDRSLFVLAPTRGKDGKEDMPTANEQFKAKINEVISDALSKFDGVELVEVKFYKEYGSFTVEALIWRKGGVDLNLCEEAHGAISDALDAVDDMFEDSYVLKVSSMGLDRPISTDDDMRRALDTEIEFKDANGKKQHGTLVSFDEDTLTLATQKGEKTFERKFITAVQPYIRF